jgi:hypothetical protein
MGSHKQKFHRNDRSIVQKMSWYFRCAFDDLNQHRNYLPTEQTGVIGRHEESLEVQ